MEYSKEAVALVESLLSESERWQYRFADIQKKKRDNLEKELEKEREKVEDYGKKDTEKLYNLQSRLDKFKEKEFLGTDDEQELINGWRHGYNNNEEKLKLRPDIKNQDRPNTDVYKARHEMLNGTRRDGPTIDNWIRNLSQKPTSKKPENVEMHERINRRTAKKDTTAKHEAAMILIEALNTLLDM